MPYFISFQICLNVSEARCRKVGMQIQAFDIAGVRVLIPRHIGDERGYFAETLRADLFAEHIGDF